MAIAGMFAKDRRGSIAIQFAIIAAPLIILAGLGVDYSRIARSEHVLQETIDNAASAYRQGLRRNRISSARMIQDLIHANTGRETARVRIRVKEEMLIIEAMDIVDTPMLSTVGQPRTAVFASAEVSKSRYGGKSNRNNAANPNRIRR